MSYICFRRARHLVASIDLTPLREWLSEYIVLEVQGLLGILLHLSEFQTV